MLTEKRNPRSKDLDKFPIKEILELINSEDRKVINVVESAIPQITKAVEAFVESFKDGGRIFYVGAGTSGRIGVLDAAELPPTFGIFPDRVKGMVAGGEKAITGAKEGREDDKQAGRMLIEKEGIKEGDLVIGISASGRTPFILGCIEVAKEENIKTVGIINNQDSPLEKICDISIVAPTGPEVLTGSTRMKAGTAQKMILNMISTTAMIKLGKIYDNMMVDLVASNQKLQKRAERILEELTEATKENIKETLIQTSYQVKLALVILKAGISKEKAIRLLGRNEGSVRKTLESLGVE